MIEVLLIVIFIVAIVIYFCVRGSDQNSSVDNYGDVNTHQFLQLQENLGNLQTTYVAQNNETNPKIESLNKVISKIHPGEKLAVMSNHNDIGNRRGLQSEEPIRQNLAPYVEKKLNKRGLKLAKNKEDGKVVLKRCSETYDYPMGYWMFVVPL